MTNFIQSSPQNAIILLIKHTKGINTDRLMVKFPQNLMKEVASLEKSLIMQSQGIYCVQCPVQDTLKIQKMHRVLLLNKIIQVKSKDRTKLCALGLD